MPPETRNPNRSALVTKFKVANRTYERRWVDCGKPNCQRCTGPDRRIASHGPYWYLCIPRNKKWFRVYLGKNLDTQRFILENGRIDWDKIRRKPRAQPVARGSRIAKDLTRKLAVPPGAGLAIDAAPQHPNQE